MVKLDLSDGRSIEIVSDNSLDDETYLPAIVEDGHPLPALFKCGDGVWRDHTTIDLYQSAVKPQQSSDAESTRPKKPKRRGRPKDTDEKADDELFNKWNLRPAGIRSYAQFGAANNLTEHQVKNGIDRARKRRNKSAR